MLYKIRYHYLMRHASLYRALASCAAHLAKSLADDSPVHAMNYDHDYVEYLAKARESIAKARKIRKGDFKNGY